MKCKVRNVKFKQRSGGPDILHNRQFKLITLLTMHGIFFGILLHITDEIYLEFSFCLLPVLSDYYVVWPRDWILYKSEQAASTALGKHSKNMVKVSQEHKQSSSYNLSKGDQESRSTPSYKYMHNMFSFLFQQSDLLLWSTGSMLYVV